MLTFRRIAITMILVVLATAIAGTAFEGTLIDDRVFSPALEGNPLGDDPVRDVTVYLPSGYYGSAARFPVVFLLHAYSERHRMYHDFVLRFDELVQAVAAEYPSQSGLEAEVYVCRAVAGAGRVG